MGTTSTEPKIPNLLILKSQQTEILPFVHCIISYNNTKITDSNSIQQIKSIFSTDKKITLTLLDLRDKKSKEVKLENKEKLGLSIKFFNSLLGIKYNKIVSCDDKSPFYDYKSFFVNKYFLGMEGIFSTEETFIVNLFRNKGKEVNFIILDENKTVMNVYTVRINETEPFLGLEYEEEIVEEAKEIQFEFTPKKLSELEKDKLVTQSEALTNEKESSLEIKTEDVIENETVKQPNLEFISSFLVEESQNTSEKTESHPEREGSIQNNITDFLKSEVNKKESECLTNENTNLNIKSEEIKSQSNKIENNEFLKEETSLPTKDSTQEYKLTDELKTEEINKTNFVEVTKEDVSSLCFKESYTNLETGFNLEEEKVKTAKELEIINQKINDELKLSDEEKDIIEKEEESLIDRNKKEEESTPKEKEEESVIFDKEKLNEIFNQSKINETEELYSPVKNDSLKNTELISDDKINEPVKSKEENVEEYSTLKTEEIKLDKEIKDVFLNGLENNSKKKEEGDFW